MKRLLINSVLLLMSSFLMAQFSVTSDVSYDFGKDSEIAGIDEVVVFEKVDGSASLGYLFTDTGLTNVEWHYHTAISDSLISSMVVNDTAEVMLDSLEQGLYELRINDTIAYYYSVIDFSEYQPRVDSVWVDDSRDSCNFVQLNASLLRQDMPVYDKLNDSTHLLAVPKTTYMWSNETKDSKSPATLKAPFENIEYACTPYSDDFFTANNLVVNYSTPDTVYAASYTAIAVSLGELEDTIPEVDDKNTFINSTTTEGSAPLDVTYSVAPEGAVQYTDWWVWNVDIGKPSATIYRNQEKITHTFLKYAPSGYRVQVVVGNESCQVLDSIDVKVTESRLEVPNVLVLGFGASGRFKVAYQSIDPSTFKAAIYNRNGRLIYKWEDPKGGWDGRSPVTGAYVSPGAYYYSIRARGTDGEKYELVGDVNVIREKGID